MPSEPRTLRLASHTEIRAGLGCNNGICFLLLLFAFDMQIFSKAKKKKTTTHESLQIKGKWNAFQSHVDWVIELLGIPPGQHSVAYRLLFAISWPFHSCNEYFEWKISRVQLRAVQNLFRSLRLLAHSQHICGVSNLQSRFSLSVRLIRNARHIVWCQMV